MENFEGTRSLKAFELYLKALCLEPRIEQGSLKISPASEEKILSWSHGQVRNPGTINYRTLRPETGGLLAEEIFGPVYDYECACGKYKGIKYKDTRCDRCGVETTHSIVRNERMGHISLASSVVHPYFQNYLASSLKIPLENLEEIVYYDKEDSNEQGASYLKEVLEKEGKDKWMIFETIPVLPAGLRPTIPVEDSYRFATSDLNDLYRRVINRNNRLKKLKEYGAPQFITQNEQRMLQESVDALFFNGFRGRPIVKFNGRQLSSLTDLTDEFKDNIKTLWRTTCDFSARGIVISDSSLKEEECGVPQKTLLELYEPLVINKFREKGFVHTIKSARMYIEKGDPSAVEFLEEVISQRPLVLVYSSKDSAKAISLYPKIKEQEAISLHPEICKNFGLKIQGEKINLHLPISEDAVKESCSFLGKVVEGDGKIESALSDLLAEDSIEPLITLVIAKKVLPLSKLEKILIN
jgi:DNA-directed RNA polymerase subunit beta'